MVVVVMVVSTSVSCTLAQNHRASRTERIVPLALFGRVFVLFVVRVLVARVLVASLFVVIHLGQQI